MSHNPLQGLKEALAFSPDNIPLRSHIAELLYQQKAYEEAAEHFKVILQAQPENK
jgi:transitional endoplasmic reticulum ATPase